MVQDIGLGVGNLGSFKGIWAQRKEFGLGERNLGSENGISAQRREFGLKKFAKDGNPFAPLSIWTPNTDIFLPVLSIQTPKIKVFSHF